MANLAQITNPSIFVSPSENLLKYIVNIKIGSDDIPIGLKNLIFKNKIKDNDLPKKCEKNVNNLMTDMDKKFIQSLNLKTKYQLPTKLPLEFTGPTASNKLLSLQDLHWLYSYIQNENKSNDKKIYLHELLKGSHIILPQNATIPRNEELEKRCKRLKAEQENRNYHKMTKNVDTLRSRLPEDTIGYQLRQMNRHLVAIFQFILSVVAGFAFGFIGVELIIGSLDFGFRLLLGIICALTIALAELYFLAKKLNEDMNFEQEMEQQNKNVKID